MKKIFILGILSILLISCSQKKQEINWEQAAFADVLQSTDEKYVMLDFVRDG